MKLFYFNGEKSEKERKKDKKSVYFEKERKKDKKSGVFLFEFKNGKKDEEELSKSDTCLLRWELSTRCGFPIKKKEKKNFVLSIFFCLKDLRIQNPADAHGPFGSLPVLHDGNLILGQAPVIASYLAAKFKLVDPTNIVLVHQLDSAAWAAEDLRILYFKNFSGSDEDKKKNQAEFPSKFSTRWFPNFGKLLHNGPYLYAQPHPTHADFAVFDIVNTIVENPLFGDAGKKALSDDAALHAWYGRVSELPAIKGWIAKRPASSF